MSINVYPSHLQIQNPCKVFLMKQLFSAIPMISTNISKANVSKYAKSGKINFINNAACRKPSVGL